MRTPGTAAIEVDDLRVAYGSNPVLHGIDLAVEAGEFVAILGSSGCGKTTLLRTIAGFQKASGGSIRLFGKDVVGVPPERRGLAMVFQSYALWPHMTVLGNVGYGLRLRGVPKAEIRSRVADVLRMLNLSGLEERKVTNLSGGQRQRVALGRALAIEPDLLLLDEPLAGVDLALRDRVLEYLVRVRDEFPVPTVYVTHHPQEMQAICEEMIVLERGRVVEQRRLNE